MTAGSRFARGVSSGWVSLIVIAVIQIWQVRFARTYLADSEFALFGILSSIVSTLLIVEAGVRSAFARLLIDAREGSEGDYRRFWSSASAVFFGQAAVIVLLCAVAIPLISFWFPIPPELLGTARLILAAQGLTTILAYALGFHSIALLATQRFVLLNFSAIGCSLAGAILFWIGIKSGAGLWSYILYGVPGTLFACVVVPQITRRVGVSRPFARRDVSASEVRRIFRLAFDLFLVSLYNLVLVNAMLIFSGALLPLALVSIVVVNFKFVQLAIQTLQRVPGTADPMLCQMIATNDMERFRRTWLIVAKSTIGLSVLGVGISYLWAGFIVAHWTSPKDTLTGWELMLFCLLPVRYIAHTVCVLSATMFKAVNRLRIPMIMELIVYAVLAFGLGKHWGLRGLLIANLASLLLGSLIPGLRLIASLGGYTQRELFAALGRTPALGLFAALALVQMNVAPEALSLPARCAWTIGWLLVVGLCIWFIGFSSSERAQILSRVPWRRATAMVG